MGQDAPTGGAVTSHFGALHLSFGLPAAAPCTLFAIVRGVAQRLQDLVVERAAVGRDDAAHILAQLRAWDAQGCRLGMHCYTYSSPG